MIQAVLFLSIYFPDYLHISTTNKFSGLKTSEGKRIFFYPTEG